MLEDGSNPENVDPEPPLNWRSKSDIHDVVLYGGTASPHVNKIRSYLYFYGIPFTHQKALKKGSPYKKMPILDVAGRQVNDSYIIIKNLIPALAGSFDEEWERKIAFKLAPSLEHNLSQEDFGNWAFHSKHGFGIPTFLRCCLEGYIHGKVKSSLEEGAQKEGLMQIVDPITILREFKAAMGSKPFFKGNEPTQVDISLYGSMIAFVNAECETVKNLLPAAGLQDWWLKMESRIPRAKLFD